MPAEIVPGSFCASYFGSFEVAGSNGDVHHVSTHGGEGPAFCDCPAFRFQRGPTYDRTCKHTKWVWEHGCFWNCQWHEGNAEVTIRPTSIGTGNVIESEHCPNCGGPLVAVLIAV